MAAWSGDSCNSLLKMLQATLNDYNESSYPIISSIEAMSCEVFVAHQGIYVKCVSVIVYVHKLFLFLFFLFLLFIGQNMSGYLRNPCSLNRERDAA